MALPALSLEMTIPPEWDRIDAIRQAVARCIAAVLGDGLRDALSVTAAELVENAIKYGRENTSIEIKLAGEGDEIVVTVINEVPKDSLGPAQLQRRLRWLGSFHDPLEGFTAALQHVYSGAVAEGGLGMARITYEGGCKVDCDTSQPGIVTVTARRAIKEAMIG